MCNSIFFFFLKVDLKWCNLEGQAGDEGNALENPKGRPACDVSE